MAGKDINIPITGDARDFIRETGDVEDALKDVSDALDDMARDTKKGGRDAERAVDSLADSFDDARKAAKNAGKAGEDAGDDIKKGMKRAEEGTAEFKDEAHSTAKEAAASFDGSAESIGDAFQEVAANAFAGFGPAGAVAGIAAAAGIGLAVAGFEAADEASKRSAENAAAWADKFIESGQRVSTAAQAAAEMIAIATDPERYADAKDKAQLWGVDVSTAMLAIAGNGAALDVVTQIMDRQAAALEANAAGADNYAQNIEQATTGQSAANDQFLKGQAALAALTGEMARGREAADNVSRGYLQLIDNASEASVQVDDLGNKVVTLPDNTQIFIDAQTGQASQNVDRFKGDLASIPSSKAVVVNGTVDLSEVTNSIRNYRAPKVWIQGEIVNRFGASLF